MKIHIKASLLSTSDMKRLVASRLITLYTSATRLSTNIAQELPPLPIDLLDADDGF